MTRRMDTRLLMTCAALGVATGLVLIPGNLLATASVAGGVIVTLLICCIYTFPPLLGLAVLRLPGTGLVVSLISGLVMAPFGPYGWAQVLTALMWGVPAELAFLATRYRRFGTTMFLAAGAFVGLAATVYSWVPFGLAELGPVPQVLAVVVQVVGSALVGWIALLLGGRLVRAGVAAGTRRSARAA